MHIYFINTCVDALKVVWQDLFLTAFDSFFFNYFLVPSLIVFFVSSFTKTAHPGFIVQGAFSLITPDLQFSLKIHFHSK